MSAVRNDDPYREQQAIAREVRETVADQLHDIVLERTGLGTMSEVVDRVRNVGHANQRILEAAGRRLQAESLGLAQSPAIKDEREARELLRATVMSLAEACGSWVVGMDVERRRRVESG